jgi:hypothetical protein
MDSRALGKLLCRALGIETKGIRKLVIAVEVGQPPIVTIERFVMSEDGGQLSGLLRAEKYGIVCLDSLHMPLTDNAP